MPSPCAPAHSTLYPSHSQASVLLLGLWAPVDGGAGLLLASSAAQGKSWPGSEKNKADRRSFHLCFLLRLCYMNCWHPCTDRANSALPYVNRTEAPEQ